MLSRRAGHLALLLLTIAVVAACGKGSTASSTSTKPSVAGGAATPAPDTAPAVRSSLTSKSNPVTVAKDPVVVGLGDSVPSGSACSCVNFVSAYAAMVAAGTDTKAIVDNDAVSGSTSADVVDQLTAVAIQAHVRSATTVLIMTGANDFNDAFDEVSLGASAKGTYTPVATAVQDNVTTVVQKIHGLNGGAHVVVLDYWAAMEDGAVAAKDYNAATMAASIACTTYVNDALAVAASATGATFLSTYTAFKGPAATTDPTALLASDGDHPDAAGHTLIARTLYAVLPKG